MAVRGVVFDVGNVIVRWDPRTLYCKIFSDPAACDAFLANVCTMEWNGRHDMGVSFADNRAALTAQHPEHAAAILAWEVRWLEMFSGAIPQTEAAMAALAARGVPLFALTNMSTEVEDIVFAMSPAFALFHDRVVSGREGIIKPDPRIFQRMIERARMAPAELLFIDDVAANVEAAAAAGFDIHHFVDPDALWPALEARGLL